MTYPPSPQYGAAPGSDPAVPGAPVPAHDQGYAYAQPYGTGPQGNYAPADGSDPAYAYAPAPAPAWDAYPAPAYGVGGAAAQTPGYDGSGFAQAPGYNGMGGGGAQAPGYDAAGYQSMPLYLAQPPAEPAKRRRGLIIGIVAGAAAVAVAASIGTAVMLMSGGPVKSVAAKVASATGSTLVVKGTFTLHDDDLYVGSDGCSGQGGYSDISAGADVTITDGAGAIVALGHLSESESAGSEECTFPFSVPDVPSGKGFYGVEVSHRGSLKYAEADLASPLSLGLGN
jgi:hypothetical protein